MLEICKWERRTTLVWKTYIRTENSFVQLEGYRLDKSSKLCNEFLLPSGLEYHKRSDTSCSVKYLDLLARAPSWESIGTIAGAETLYNHKIRNWDLVQTTRQLSWKVWKIYNNNCCFANYGNTLWLNLNLLHLAYAFIQVLFLYTAPQ